MTHYLELSSGSEHKFYELTLDELTLHLRYGRIGTEGQRQIKIHPDADAAKRDVEKRLAEKRRKGYIDAVPGERLKQAITPARLRLPPLLKAHRERIEATLKPVVVLQRDPRPAALWHSKIGGVPYRPQGQVWPHTPDGRCIFFANPASDSELIRRAILNSPGGLLGTRDSPVILKDDQEACEYAEDSRSAAAQTRTPSQRF